MIHSWIIYLEDGQTTVDAEGMLLMESRVVFTRAGQIVGLFMLDAIVGVERLEATK